MNVLYSLCQSYEGENFVEFGKLLLDKHGINVNAKDHCGRNAVHCLCDREHDKRHRDPKGSIEIMKFLIESGIDVNVKDIFGRIALHCLCESLYDDKNRVELAKLLLLNFSEADINATDKFGRTALHCLLLTSMEGKMTVKLLIENRINIEAKDALGKGALYYLKHAYEGGNKADIEKTILSSVMVGEEISQ